MVEPKRTLTPVTGYFGNRYEVRGLPLSTLPRVWVEIDGGPFRFHDYLSAEDAREWAGRLLAAAIKVETARGT